MTKKHDVFSQIVLPDVVCDQPEENETYTIGDDEMIDVIIANNTESPHMNVEASVNGSRFETIDLVMPGGKLKHSFSVGHVDPHGTDTPITFRFVESPSQSNTYDFIASKGPDDTVGDPPPPCRNLPRIKHDEEQVILVLPRSVNNGTCGGCDVLSRPTLLVHNNSKKYACYWFSSGLNCCKDASKPAFWRLQKRTITTWTLTLRREVVDRQGNHSFINLVTYVAHTRAGKRRKPLFPITLVRKGRRDGSCLNWPSKVTIDIYNP